MAWMALPGGDLNRHLHRLGETVAHVSINWFNALDVHISDHLWAHPDNHTRTQNADSGPFSLLIANNVRSQFSVSLHVVCSWHCLLLCQEFLSLLWHMHTWHGFMLKVHNASLWTCNHSSITYNPQMMSQAGKWRNWREEKREIAWERWIDRKRERERQQLSGHAPN